MSDSLITPASRGFLYETRFSVPFHLADPVGVMFFGNIYGVVHTLLEEYGREVGVWQSWFRANQGVGYPIRHCEADYFRFMSHGQTFRVAIRCVSLSASSMKLETEFSHEGVVHARVQTVHTAIDIATHRKGEITPDLRELFSKSLQ
ncbi:MAG: hypothetical protein RJB38_1031 [Pseudomonadota bacterium]|jgi:acyl-CoA thioester hydrolase/1,4-dihydroxy-2-naphthoyl-CoA hydrolase